jgi:hypothetical protein
VLNLDSETSLLSKHPQQRQPTQRELQEFCSKSDQYPHRTEGCNRTVVKNATHLFRPTRQMASCPAATRRVLVFASTHCLSTMGSCNTCSSCDCMLSCTLFYRLHALSALLVSISLGDGRRAWESRLERLATVPMRARRPQWLRARVSRCYQSCSLLFPSSAWVGSSSPLSCGTISNTCNAYTRSDFVGTKV